MIEFLANNLFYIFAFFATVGAVGLISFKHPLNSAISFILTLLSMAGFYALLSAKMLFAMQVIVYAGAIMVLILFVIMFLNVTKKDLVQEPKKNLLFIIVAITLSPILLFIIGANFESVEFIVVNEEFGTIKEVGKTLFLEWVYPFELVSILLLVSIIGSVVIAKERE